MSDPEWYSEWWNEAFRELQEKNARLETEFRLGSWPRFDYDLDAGMLTFSQADRRPQVVAEIQVAGTTSARSGNWMWAWANGHLPKERIEDASRTRVFGEEHGISELIEDYAQAKNLDGLGWKFIAITTRVAGGVGGYRAPGSIASVFLVLRSVAWAA